MRTAVNFVLFQIGWFSCVLGAANGMAWLGPVVVLMVVAVHLKMSLRPGKEFRLIAMAMGIGLLVDTLLLSTGWLSYPSGAWFGMLAPYWIVAMWALFATTLNVSMGWLKERPFLAVIMGAIGGPMSYYAGQKLGAIELTHFSLALAALAVAWAIAMPLLAWLSVRLDGVSQSSEADVTPWPWKVSSHA